MTIESNLSARDTPVGRRYEVKVAFFDCVFLILGCIGVALWFEPLIYLSAIGHLVSKIFIIVVKWFGIMVEAIMVAVSSAVFIAAAYAVESFYRDVPSDRVLEYIQLNLLLLIASAVVVSGIVGALLSHVGNLDRLREYIDNKA
ncbi:MAG TPA: hypothetical protein VMM55_02955 [Thermohalobaculum sp.]|nr:hypothetical protein [Thermohalobaculum sp.]